MLDISFAEILVITLVALVVLGPQEMPKVLLWLGRAVRWVKTQIRAADTALTRIVDEAELEEYRHHAEKKAKEGNVKK